MKTRAKTEGYVVIDKPWLGKVFRVVGIGQSIPDAWRDAAEKRTQGRSDARQFIIDNPHLKCVECEISVTFDKPEVPA